MEYPIIAQHYENCFQQHGPNHLGVDWPNQADLEKRFGVMIDAIPRKHLPCTLLDFGCGPGLLLKWLKDQWLVASSQCWATYKYIGCDLSSKFIEYCQRTYSQPGIHAVPSAQFIQLDAIKNPEKLPDFDYAILNGVLTMKMSLSYEDMWKFFTQLITTLYQKANHGIAFNLMSKQVDWERNDLFHVPLDDLASFLTKNLSRHFVIRNDYGLYEYSVYLYKEPNIK